MKGNIDLRTGEPYAQLIFTNADFAIFVGRYFQINEDHVVSTAGAMGAIESVRNHVLKNSNRKNPTVLTVSPGYWRARKSFEGLGFKIIDVKTQKNGFAINELEVVRKAREKKPDLVYLSLPNNPTGAIFDAKKIIKAIPKKTFIIIDMTLPSQKIDTKKFLKNLFIQFKGKENLFLVGSPSKSHGTAEQRIGWCICTNLKNANELKKENKNVLPIHSVKEGIKKIQKKNTTIEKLLKSFSLLKKGKNKDNFEIVTPMKMVETGYVVIKLNVAASKLRKTLEKKKILVMWGSEFGLTNAYIRLETLEPSNIKKFVDAINYL